MKSDLKYQKSPKINMPFMSNGVRIYFSDHASHALMSGQYMME